MLNKALSEIRKYHKIQIKELADMIHMSRHHLSNIENGLRSANLRHVKKYSDVFGLTESDAVILSRYIYNSQEILTFNNVSDKLKRIAQRIVDANQVKTGGEK